MNFRRSPYLSLVLLAPFAVALLLIRPAGSTSDAAEEPKPSAERKFTPEEIAFFEKEVRPLLEAKCVRCHGGEKVKGKLKLTNRADVLKGGTLGPAVSLDAPDKSRLLQAIHYRDGLEM